MREAAQRLDVTDLIPSRLGTAIHDSIEAAWKKGYAKAMLRLGYPKKLIARIRINPSDAELAADPTSSRSTSSNATSGPSRWTVCES